ncbi:Protein A6-like protein [Bienertia sinuspersici]
MCLAYESGYRRVVMESDCLNLISKIKNKEKPLNVVGYIVEDILKSANSFDFYAFNHVKWEGNYVAHSIAKFEFDHVNELVWLEDFPDFALDLASRDMLNII